MCGYFNLVPIVITVLPPVRLHVLRRYIHELSNDKTLAAWKDRFVVPEDRFLPLRFLELVGQHRKIYLRGQSGIGKMSFFKFLVSTQLANAAKRQPLRKMVPVFLPLSRYKGCKPQK
jgi:hypothetical protein